MKKQPFMIFYKTRVASIFKHLKGTAPAIQKDVDEYFAALDKNIGMIYHHRKEFEESIAKINEQVSRFVDREQVSVQQIFLIILNVM
jgi:ABC-type enterochelin transport system substrate-binding protein